MPQGASPLPRNHHHRIDLALFASTTAGADHQDVVAEVETATAPATMPPQPLDTPGLMPQPSSQSHRELSSTTSTSTDIGSSSPMEAASTGHVGRKNNMSKEERRRKLESDPWVEEVEPKRIKCLGCREWKVTDQRSEYFDGLWIKHRNKCREIMRLTGAQIPKVL
ncbi:hypothetical protein DXG03_002948 [Asterophora parasitica]|uniref:Uncharacterized protein n=1 Tax=Asterophora parasitica TaxID=117018 RepID=A0A9P7K9L2_9AGAR|nr:hypothetical protein DXG03_002948 [Asterophora parasitica]